MGHGSSSAASNGAPAGSAEERLTLTLIGPLRLTAPDGRDLTPPILRAQGLLALLAAGAGHRRSRAWLQDKLWSGSEAEQGASSLRQTVLRLRHALGRHAAILTSERGWLGLDPQRVEVRDDPAALDPFGTAEPPEWCEGLDIPDPEFEDWIRDQRFDFADRAEAARDAARARLRTPSAPPQQQTRPILLLAGSLASTPELTALGEVLLGDVASQIASLGAALTLVAQAEAPAPALDSVFRLRVWGVDGPDGAMFRLQLEHCRTGALLRHIGRSFPRGRPDLSQTSAYQRFVSEAAHVLAHEIGRGGGASGEREAAWALGYRALGLATSFSLAAHREGDRLLAQACEIHPAPAYLAWRAHFRVAAIIERHLDDVAPVLDEAERLAALAREQDPYNSLVLAVSSDVAALVGGRDAEAFDLARRAVETDPANVYARASLAYRIAWTHDASRAHLEARRALALAEGAANSALWWMMCCMTATRCERFDEAIRCGEEAHRRAPEFRAPLRYLAALHYRAGRAVDCLRYLEKLKRLEPDFSVEMFADEAYPVETLRRLRLVEVAKSALL